MIKRVNPNIVLGRGESKKQEEGHLGDLPSVCRSQTGTSKKLLDLRRKCDYIMDDVIEHIIKDDGLTLT